MSKKSKMEFSKYLRFLNNRSENTQRAYQTTLKHYEGYHGTSMERLVIEALDEQTQRVPQHQLKVIDRIEDFQNYLIDEGYVYGTIRIHVTRIKTIYRKNRVYLPYIEEINPKTCKHREVIEYKDVLTKDELRVIMPHFRLPVRARAMVMVQGGLSNEECEHLTTRAFIDETYKYHECSDDVDALKWLADEYNPIIWVTKLVRVKTGKPYYAVIGAEAVNTIAKAKLYELDLPSNDGCIPEKLLNTFKLSINRRCAVINDLLGLGKVAEENKLKPHNLRRFHATYIRGGVLNYEESSRISNSEIDEMQGRGKTNVQDTYIKTNPLEQKLIYAKVMNNVSLYHEYEYELTDDDVIVKVVDASKLRREVNDLQRELHKKRIASEKVQELRKSLGNDVFDAMIMDILKTS